MVFFLNISWPWINEAPERIGTRIHRHT